MSSPHRWPCGAPVAIALLLSAACVGVTPAPVMEGRAGMLSKSAISQRCEEAAQGHLKPFVIEWDATDLASFEARATMATVLVRYDGCTLEPVYGCSDRANPTVFGSYGSPHFTSGTVQKLDVKNEGQLYAELPLGAAKFSGRLQRGESLHLEYFVSGVAMSSREEFHRSELASYGGCAEATHFVWAYNLGAFELMSEEKDRSEGKASVALVAKAEGEGSHQQSSLGSGGEIASCKSQDQRACRTPIRLVLRPITDGDRPAAGLPAPGTAAPAMSPGTPIDGDRIRAEVEETMAIHRNASAAADAAREAEQAGDGVACLRHIDRAVGLSPAQDDGLRHTRPRCLMLAGKCDEGRQALRELLATRDTKRIRSDEDLDREVRATSNRICAPESATNDADYVMRATSRMHKLREAKQGTECRRYFVETEKRIKKIMAKADRDEFEKRATAATHGSMDSAAFCVAETQGCAAGFELYWRSYALKLRGRKDEEIKRIARSPWTTLQDQKHFSCQ